MKKLMCLLLAAAMMLSLAACGGSNTESTKSTEGTKIDKNGTIKIGATGPLTGGAALYGLAAQRGAQIAVEEINAKGGVKFELKYEDDAHDAEKANNAFNNLIDWGMQLSLGSVTSAPCRNTAALAAEEGIFCLTPSASAPACIEAGKGWEFQMCFSDTNQGSASAQYISDKKLGSKIAIIYKNDEDYSTGIRDTFVAKAKELNLEIVTEQTFTADSSTDFSVQVAAAKAAGADLLFLPMYYDPASLIITECNKIGYDVKFFGVDGMDGILDIKGFDTKLAEGVMLLTPFVADAKDADTQSFVKKYQEKWNETPIQFAADAYDCIYAIYQAYMNSDATASMSAKDLSKLMKETFSSASFKFSGLTGDDMTWDAAGAVSKPPKGMKIVNGAYASMD